MDGLIASLVDYWPSAEVQAWIIATYATSLRSSMFTGFLTLSGFLLSATTFIVIQMKKEVYDQEYYLDRWKQQKDLGTEKPLYGPLRCMSRLLVVTITMSLSASLSHITIGLIASFVTVLICYILSIVVLVAVAFVLYLISQNLRMWFDDMETAAQKRLSELQGRPSK